MLALGQDTEFLWPCEAYSVEGLSDSRHLECPGMATFDSALP